jgi:hypothetical protein
VPYLNMSVCPIRLVVHCTDFVLALYFIPTGQKQEHVPEQLFDIVSGLGTGLDEHHIKFFGLNTIIYMKANFISHFQTMQPVYGT